MTFNFDPEYYRKHNLADLYSIRDSLKAGSEPRVIVERVIQEKLDEKEHGQHNSNLSYALWAGFLTINGIIIALFGTPLMSSIQPDALSRVLIGLSLVSCFVVLLLFQHSRREPKQPSLDETGKHERQTKNYEQVCYGIVILQLLVVAMKFIR